jgi:hypothetical protein
MGVQKYRFDKIGEPAANGAVPLYTEWMGGPSLAGIRNCPCGDYGARTAYVTGEADTWFSVPAAIQVKRKRITGWIGCEDGNWQFHPNQAEQASVE